MSDMLFNSLMLGFFGVMIWAALSDMVPTGASGSVGCLLMGIAAVMTVDDSFLSGVEAIELTLCTFCVGAVLLICNIAAEGRRRARAMLQEIEEAAQ